MLITNVFKDKKRISYEEYVDIIKEMTSEMFLSILTLLQNNLPASKNFYRYKKNFEKFGGTDGQEGENVIQTIASPVLMSKLSPIV